MVFDFYFTDFLSPRQCLLSTEDSILHLLMIATLCHDLLHTEDIKQPSDIQIKIALILLSTEDSICLLLLLEIALSAKYNMHNQLQIAFLHHLKTLLPTEDKTCHLLKIKFAIDIWRSSLNINTAIYPLFNQTKMSTSHQQTFGFPPLDFAS